MKIRTSQPKNNKYYIRQATGGLNGAVTGYPTISGANVLCNCVGYANGRFNEIINDPDLKGVVKSFKYQLVCNAENFIESAKRQGLKISASPITGGIMVWQKGRTLGGGDGAGHVAVVEEVYSDGTILTSESGYGAWAFKTIRRSNSNGRWGQSSAYKFRGCIINPSIKDAKVVPAPKLSIDGIGGEATVRAMQKFFGTPADGIISGQNSSQKKFYPALKSVKCNGGGSPCVKKLQKWLGITQDGVIGKQTVKAWQKMLGVNADGIFGSASMKAWQKYLNANDKAVYPKPVTPTTTSWVDKANAWARKIADSKYHYVKWKPKVEATHTCPICKGRKYDNYYGWNCVGYASAIWHHGGGLKSTCNCHTLGTDEGNKMIKMTEAQALKFAQKEMGLKDLKVIINKKGIPKSQWKAGDLCMMFNGNYYKHMFYYMGGGKIADASNYSDNKKDIAIRSYKNYHCKIIVRYIGK